MTFAMSVGTPVRWVTRFAISIAQGLCAGNSGIAGVPGARGGMHRVKDRGCGADVMLADGQLQHVLARRDHRAGAVEHVPPVRAAGIEPGDPV